MNIRQKILIYFSVLSISLVGIAFVLIYVLSSNYRMEEFQQRIKDNTTTTLRFLVEIKQINHDLLQTMDENTINNLYKEKLLIFDNEKKLIYSSLDDTKIEYPDLILDHLNVSSPLIEFEEEGFDVVAMLFEFNNKHYYAIAKAYDKFGHSKIEYLKYVLISVFVVISSIILISSFLLARQISQPINQIAMQLKKINFDSQNNFISLPESKDEIFLLATRFNELMQRLHNSFSFQRHAVHHISHELKTPIAILVSNFERMEHETDIETLRQRLQHQKEDTKTLGDIVNALLEISKVETGSRKLTEEVRVDEVVFEVVDDMKTLNESFTFEVELGESIVNEQSLTITGNKKMLRLAIVNLVVNCLQYSYDQKAVINIHSEADSLCVDFINKGKVIAESEKRFLFQHFFRGENSKGKRGFGLGLVLISKITHLHNGEISYRSLDSATNMFSLKLPLSHNRTASYPPTASSANVG